jgi:hypothetical protein
VGCLFQEARLDVTTTDRSVALPHQLDKLTSRGTFRATTSGRSHPSEQAVGTSSGAPGNRAPPIGTGSIYPSSEWETSRRLLNGANQGTLGPVLRP